MNRYSIVINTESTALARNALAILDGAEVILEASDSAAASSGIATTQAAAAAVSASEAAVSVSVARSIFQSLGENYLGTSTTNPTVGGSGEPLAAGMSYFNTTAGEMRFYTGSTWESVGQSSSDAFASAEAASLSAAAAAASAATAGGHSTAAGVQATAADASAVAAAGAAAAADTSATEAANSAAAAAGSALSAAIGLSQGARTETTVQVTSTSGTPATLQSATEALAGMMRASDKAKLNAIEAGAQVNVPANLAQGERTTSTVQITSSSGTSATLQGATESLAGMFSAADKATLNLLSATFTATRTFRTRGELATWAASNTPLAGGVYLAGGQAYLGQTSATAIAGIPGVVPFGPTTPEHFGAVGNGSTDDTAAINAASAYWQAKVLPQVGGTPDTWNGEGRLLSSEFHFTGGAVYSVSSVDFTSINAPRNASIKGNGAILRGNTAGRCILDMIESRWMEVQDLVIQSISTTKARSGIQIGKRQDNTVGNNKFRNVKIVGYYTLAPMANFGSETTVHSCCEYIQQDTASGAYAVYADGMLRELPNTENLAIIAPGGGWPKRTSFTNNLYCDGTQIRNEGGGAALFCAVTRSHHIEKGCYLLTRNSHGIVMYQSSASATGPDGLTDENDDFSCEALIESAQLDVPTPGNIGLINTVRFIGDATATQIRGFKLSDWISAASNAILKNDTGAALTISDLDLRVPKHHPARTTVNFFSAGNNIHLRGNISTDAAATVNLGALASFTGTLHCGSFDALTALPPAGSLVIFSADDGATYTTGPFLPITSIIRRDGDATVTAIPSSTLTAATSFIALNVAGGGNITDIVNGTGTLGFMQVRIRSTGGAAVTFVHNTAKLRLKGGANVTLGVGYGSITFDQIATGVWQEV